jgi:polyisoprenoid-binding protein YceI
MPGTSVAGCELLPEPVRDANLTPGGLCASCGETNALRSATTASADRRGIHMTATTPAVVPAGLWEVDRSHSRLEFSARHMAIASVRGIFSEYAGALEVLPDRARAFGTVEVASLDTGDRQRDEHLRSPDFLDAETHPRISFESSSIRPVREAVFEITGDLTIRGRTHELILCAEVHGVDTDPYGNERVGIAVTGELDRRDYEMRFNQALGSGNMLVGHEVTIRLDISAIRKSHPVAQLRRVA